MKLTTKEERFWDMMSSKTDRIALNFVQTYKDSIEATKKYLKPEYCVLDFACGTGLVCNEIAPYVKSINAIDISSKMIEIAANKANDKKIVNIVFDNTSIFDNNKLTDEAFDVAFAFNILHLVKDSNSLLIRLKKLLKNQGYLISSTECAGENKKSILNKFVGMLIKLHIVPYMTFFKTTDLTNLMQKNGFTVIETQSYYNHNQPNFFIVAKKA